MTTRCPRLDQLLWIGLLARVLAGPGAVWAADAAIAAPVAGLYVGREVVVEGRVESAERVDNSVRLRLGAHPQSFTVALVRGLLDAFPPQPEQHYLGKNVRVAGLVQSFRGTPEIRLRDASLIQIVDAGVAGRGSEEGAAAARSREAAELRRELERLQAQMRAMETRLQQLEPPPR